MNKSAILRIFEGDCTQEIMDGPKNKELSHETCNLYDQIKAELNPEMQVLLQKYDDLRSLSLCEHIDFFFVEGFKLALQLAAECLT